MSQAFTEGFSARDAFRVIFRRKALIFLIVFMSVLMMGVYSYLVLPTYEAKKAEITQQLSMGVVQPEMLKTVEKLRDLVFNSDGLTGPAKETRQSVRESEWRDRRTTAPLVSDSKVRVDTPVLAGLQAYGPIVEQLSKGAIAQALNLFNASEGRYPNSYDEFMTRIIKENNIQLPVLPGGKKYQYDVEKHELVVIEAPGDSAPANP